MGDEDAEHATHEEGRGKAAAPARPRRRLNGSAKANPCGQRSPFGARGPLPTCPTPRSPLRPGLAKGASSGGPHPIPRRCPGGAGRAALDAPGGGEGAAPRDPPTTTGCGAAGITRKDPPPSGAHLPGGSPAAGGGEPQPGRRAGNSLAGQRAPGSPAGSPGAPNATQNGRSQKEAPRLRERGRRRPPPPPSLCAGSPPGIPPPRRPRLQGR